MGINSEKSFTQQNVEETNRENSGDRLIQREEIGGTPFVAIKLEEGGWFLTMGNHRLSEEFADLDELKIWMGGNHVNWDILLNVIIILQREIKNKEA